MEVKQKRDYVIIRVLAKLHKKRALTEERPQCQQFRKLLLLLE